MVKKLKNPSLLIDVATNAKDWRVRDDATVNLKDKVVLASIAKNDYDWHVRKTAAGKLQDQNILATIIRSDNNLLVRKAALEMLFDRNLLTEVAKNNSNLEIRKAAAEKLKDKNVLSEITSDIAIKNELRNAVDKLLEIYSSVENGYSSLDENVMTLRKIGEELNEQGGIKLMQEAFTDFRTECNTEGAPRNLEHQWNGIGDWLG
jgi:hypothetical protein